MTTRTDRLVFCVVACVIYGSAAGAQVRLQPYASGFFLPVGFVQDPVDPSVHYVIEQPGRVRPVRGGVTLTPDFLDLQSVVSCCGERGLLGLAFAPDYAVSRRFYVNFTNPAGHTVVARFKRSATNPLVADPASRFDLKWASLGDSPFIPHVPAFGNHNGGDLAFGPDGFLYIGLGDGGSGNDPFNRSQSGDTLLGKMLRIDVNVLDADAHGYRVPVDNPFVGGSPPIAALPEIWAFGLRNPFRFTFDTGPGGTGAMLIADVGQNAREEIDYEPAGRGGRNYGWSILEGTRPNNTGFAAAYMPFTPPVYEYTHADGFVVTGGFTYRGTALSAALRGRYFFTDFGTGRLWSIGLAVNSVTGEATLTNVIEHTEEVGGRTVVSSVTSFGRDADGELYLVQYSGTIQKLVAPPDPPRALFAARFDGNASPDILSQGASGRATIALAAGSLFNSIRTIYDDVTAWRVVGAGDLNNDGRADIVWQGPTGSVVAWLLDAAGSPTPAIIYGGESTWRVAAVGDVDGDGDADLVWQSSTGRAVVWILQGIVVAQTRDLWPLSSVWRIVGAVDLNSDGVADVLWQGPSGALVAWNMSGGSPVAVVSIFGGVTEWMVIGVGDLNGDSEGDLLWRAPGGQIGVWLMTGPNRSQVMYLRARGRQWELSATP